MRQNTTKLEWACPPKKGEKNKYTVGSHDAKSSSIHMCTYPNTHTHTESSFGEWRVYVGWPPKKRKTKSTQRALKMKGVAPYRVARTHRMP